MRKLLHFIGKSERGDEIWQKDGAFFKRILVNETIEVWIHISSGTWHENTKIGLELSEQRKEYLANKPKSITYRNVKNEGGNCFIFRPGAGVPFLTQEGNVFDITITEKKVEE